MILPAIFLWANAQGQVLFLGLGAIVFFLALVVFLRWSVALPSIAIGQSIGLTESWEATKGHVRTICVLALFGVMMHFGGQAVLGLLSLIPIVGAPVSLFLSFLILPLINVSILTTMYGVFVEGRSLV